jgi:ribosome-interacting GTPase 1
MYEFTKLTCIPGIIHYNDVKIQLLDLPGIIEGTSKRKGRGRYVCAWDRELMKCLHILTYQ